MKTDSRTTEYKELCSKIAYLKNSEIPGFKKGEIFSTPSTYSKTDHSRIGDGPPHTCKTLKALIFRGITDQISARIGSKKKEVAQIGYNPKGKVWYGWSHRAIGGFAIGDPFFDKKETTRLCRTLDDCKLSASNFADSVS